MKHSRINAKNILYCLINLLIVFFAVKNNSYATPATYTPLITIPTDTILPSFLVISDIHLHHEMNQLELKDTSDDSGDDLWNSAKDQINSIVKNNNVQFIIFLGDAPWHAYAFKGDSIESARKSSGLVLKDLRTYSQKADVPCIYVPGNNDSYTADYKRFSDSIFAYDSNGKHWPVIPGKSNTKNAVEIIDQLDSSWKKGYYSVYPLGANSKLRLIVLNTVIFNKWYPDTFRFGDAKDEMNWFENQLQSATTKNEKILIAMHIPPGKDGYLSENVTTQELVNQDLWDTSLRYKGISVLNYFIDLDSIYEDNIIGFISSHSHMDGLRLIMNGTSHPSLLISVPAITPGHKNNPSMKLIKYRAKSFILQDFTTYYMKYWNCNDSGSLKQKWNSYTFRQEFNCLSQNPIIDEVDSMMKDKEGLFKYLDNIYTVKNGIPIRSGNNAHITFFVKRRL